MKRFLLLPIVMFFFLGCGQCKHTQHGQNDLFSFFRYREGRKPYISVHRGGGDYGGYPENCIESFEYITKQIPSPLIIECDIECSKDSVLLMMHDHSLERTTNGTGKIIDKTWEELKHITLKDNQGNKTPFKIPTLDQVLDWGKDKVIYMLDVKRNTPYRKVVEAIRQHEAKSYCAVITYEAKQAKLVYQLDSTLLISVTMRDYKEYEMHHQAGIPDRNMIAFIGSREPNKEFCDFLHQKGIVTILGTLGNLDHMAKARGDRLYIKWIKDGADIIATDRPIEAYKTIATLN